MTRKIGWHVAAVSRPVLIALAGVAALAAASAPLGACDIPVFRYALERWAPESYQVLVFRRGELAPDAKQALAAFKELGGKTTNLAVRDIDVAGAMAADDKLIWQAQGDAALPWVVVLFPDAPPQIPAVWSGRLTASVPARLADSPLRRAIADRLLQGESAVWVLLESGDKARDSAAVKLLEEQLAGLQQTLKLPQLDPDAPGPRLWSQLPLRLAFSVVRLSRRDAHEEVFINMLTRADKELAECKEPVAFPVFGRGRALAAILGKDLTAQVVADASAYLIGACSCQVKEENPGFDLLLTADWNALVENRPPPPEAPRLPSLAAVAQLAQPPAAAPGAASTSVPVRGSAHWSLPVLAGATLAAVGIVVALVSVVLVRKGRREKVSG